MMETSQDFLLPSESYVAESPVVKEFIKIMKVIDLNNSKEASKNSRFYSLLSFTRPHENP